MPIITKPNQHFDAVTRNGFGSSGGSITSLNFQPDFWWEKARSTISNHTLIDSIRGVNKELYSNLTNAESTGSNFLTSFNSNGFTMGSNDWGTGTTLVDWVWKAGGTAVTNTNGTQTSTVSVNTTAGFSIVTFTCTGLNVNGTVGHGLGVAPKFIITKSVGSGSNWVVYHSSVSTDVNKFLRLNDDSALTTLSNVWGDALPTSTVFGIRGDVTLAASATAVAYCFAEVDGYSKFGSYTGNGSTDGPFIYTGFRPRFLLVKRSNSSGTYWNMYDTNRSVSNVTDDILYANLSDAEVANEATLAFDILSNGFKARTTGTSINGNGNTYVYVAFAEAPFKFANAR